MTACLLIVILNFSHIPNATVERWANAIDRQVQEDLAPLWHTPSACVVFGSASTPPGAWQVRIADVPHAGQLGHHLATGRKGMPYADILISSHPGDIPISAVVSHEVIEMLVDPWDDRFILDYPYFWFVEPADPVQGLTYERDGVVLEDFVLPQWYDALSRDARRFDFLGVVRHPGECMHGKASRADMRDGTWEAINGF